ncbi:helix-turn-helix domain-containing protein [Aminiphilus circumscriptus]|uniref:helix-turn-helix domain-containing protein n=1 Tax=Aminiphilus circumscriptus TaxID=290732 RepID=UPI00046F2DC1|nr:helix-turn-helix transcriptional regulator [Aminiphilus circumscriptus]
MSFDDTKCRTHLSALAENIRRARIKAGLSQVELAEKCALSQGNLSRIETGERRPSVLLLFRIAEVLELSPTRLLARRGRERGFPCRRAEVPRAGCIAEMEAEAGSDAATAVSAASGVNSQTGTNGTGGTGGTNGANGVVRAERADAGWAFRVASSERRGALP